MSKSSFEFVKEFDCACGRRHTTQVDDVIVEKGAIHKVIDALDDPKTTVHS